MGDRAPACRAPQALTKAALICLVPLCLALGAQGAAGAEIVRWVDANGVTQFTDPQFAPAPATVVDVQPTNGMVVPSHAIGHGTGKPTFSRISKPPKQNKRGWRGYGGTRMRGSSRSRHRR